jgi:hypothetical protein
MVLRHDMTLAGCKARLSFKEQAIIQLHSEITWCFSIHRLQCPWCMQLGFQNPKSKKYFYQHLRVGGLTDVLGHFLQCILHMMNSMKWKCAVRLLSAPVIQGTVCTFQIYLSSLSWQFCLRGIWSLEMYMIWLSAHIPGCWTKICTMEFCPSSGDDIVV